MAGLDIKQSAHDVIFTVKVVPSSSQTRFAGLMGEMLKVRVSAPPEKGKANQCLISFLAERLGVKNTAVKIIKGTAGPVKQIRILDVSLEDVWGRLAPVLSLSDKK